MPQRGVPPPGIAEALDAIEHIGLGLSARAVYPRGRAFSLEREEEALHHRIVPEVTRPTHAAGDADYPGDGCRDCGTVSDRDGSDGDGQESYSSALQCESESGAMPDCADI